MRYQQLTLTSLLAACLGMAASPALSANWNAVAQFSHVLNPNGQWSYYDDVSHPPLKPAKNISGLHKVSGWWDQQGYPNSVIILKNGSGVTVNYLTIVAPTDHLWMDPETGTATVQWTAPVAGTFGIRGDFLGIDTGQHAHPVDVAIGGGGALFNATISAYGQSAGFNIRRALVAGQVITFDVSVGPGGDPNNLSTGLKVEISQLIE